MRKDPGKALAEMETKLEQQRHRRAEDQRKQKAKQKKEFNWSCYLIGKRMLEVFPELNGSGTVDHQMLDRIIFSLENYLGEIAVERQSGALIHPKEKETTDGQLPLKHETHSAEQRPIHCRSHGLHHW